MQLLKSTGVIVIGGLLLGCQNGKNGSGPKAAAPEGSSLGAGDEQTAAELQRTYRASHPGQQVGFVNAVDPGRRIISVSGIPPEMVRPGAIMSILTAGGGTVEAVAYAHDYGYVQLRYEPLGPGQTAPATGELAIWNPSGQTVIPEGIPPVGTPPTGVAPTGTGAAGTGTGAVINPATTEPPPPPPPVVPATMPADQARPTTYPLTDIQPPATQPAVPTIETPPPPPPVSPTTMPATRPALDINK
jgi:hypothetical protein